MKRKVQILDIKEERLDSLGHIGKASFYILRLIFGPGCGLAESPYRERRWLFYDKHTLGMMVRELSPGEILVDEPAWLKA